MSDKINCSLQGIFCLKLRKTIEKLQGDSGKIWNYIKKPFAEKISSTKGFLYNVFDIILALLEDMIFLCLF